MCVLLSFLGPGKLIDMPLEQLYKVVNTNVVGEEFQDLALSALRDEDSQGHIGLWPEAALINHSCTPNATSELSTLSPSYHGMQASALSSALPPYLDHLGGVTLPDYRIETLSRSDALLPPSDGVSQPL